MRPSKIGPGITLLMALVAILPTGATAQRGIDIPTICLDEMSPAAQVECATKYAAFYAYLGQMGVGVSTHQLAPELAEAIQEYFPGIDVSAWRFGYSNRQPADNATTACEVTYFNDQAQIEQMRTGNDLSRIYWLGHEIRHYEQCVEVGGRDAYSKLWWDDFDAVALDQLLKGGNMDDLHDAMAMEADAAARGNELVAALLDCCIHPVDQVFMPAAQIDPMTLNRTEVKVGDAIAMSVTGSGGAEPWFAYWKSVGPGGEVQIAEGMSAAWRPEVAGDYTLRLDLAQAVTQCGNGYINVLPCHSEERSIRVEPRTPRVTDLRVTSGMLDVGGTANLEITAEDIPDGETLSVNVSSSLALVDAPSAASVQGTGGWAGSGSFQVTASMDDGTLLLGDRNVTIRAGFGTDSRDWVEATVTVNGYDVQDFRAVPVKDRMGREIYEIRVRLDRRVRVPVTLQLESADPRALSLPGSLTIRAGASEGVLRVEAPRTLRRATDVTVRLRHPSPQFSTRESVVTVRPGGR